MYEEEQQLSLAHPGVMHFVGNADGSTFRTTSVRSDVIPFYR